MEPFVPSLHGFRSDPIGVRRRGNTNPFPPQGRAFPFLLTLDSASGGLLQQISLRNIRFHKKMGEVLLLIG